MRDERTDELRETMERYKRTVYGIALSQLSSIHEADDLFQEVFLLYFTKAPVFDSEAQKRSWLIRTAVNKCRQFNSARWHSHIDKTREPDENALTAPWPEEEREVFEAVRGLPENYREPIWLHCFLGLTVGETGEVLGLRAGAVSMRLERGRRLLRKRLEGD